MKVRGSSIERSTWVSAARFTTAAGRCSRKTASTASRSPMSACTKVNRGSRSTSARLARLPAYVSLSTTTTRSAHSRSARRTRFDPMNPAPPVMTSASTAPIIHAPSIAPAPGGAPRRSVSRLHLGARGTVARRAGYAHRRGGEMVEVRRVLVVVAHPDDAEFGCGGTVARWVADGCEVFYCLLTSGNRGSDDPAMLPERLAVVRREEQLQAAGVLGVREVDFLGYPDGELEDTRDARRDVVRAIRRFRPDRLVCQNPFPSLNPYIG